MCDYVHAAHSMMHCIHVCEVVTIVVVTVLETSSISLCYRKHVLPVDIGLVLGYCNNAFHEVHCFSFNHGQHYGRLAVSKGLVVVVNQAVGWLTVNRFVHRAILIEKIMKQDTAVNTDLSSSN